VISNWSNPSIKKVKLYRLSKKLSSIKQLAVVKTVKQNKLPTIKEGNTVHYILVHVHKLESTKKNRITHGQKMQTL
jgi:hypothetical protein